MGCIWSSKPSNHCSVCYCKQTRDSGFINNKCRRCVLAEQSRPSSTLQFHEYTYTVERTSNPSLNRSNVRGKLPQPRPNITYKDIKKTSEEPQCGQYRCKLCGRSWQSLRSWSTKYQMCKRCKNPVYPHNLRDLLSSDFKSTKEDPIEHERELCQMCKHLGYACKDYGRNVKRW